MASKGQASKRVPGKHIENPKVAAKDGYMVKECDVTNAWRRIGGSSQGKSLKQFMRELADHGDVNAKRWLHNKRVNTSKNQLGLGCTRKKKGGNSGGKGSGK